MPGFDGTGPNGRGPMTGRGMGSCGRSRGFGRRIFGRFFGNRVTKEEEKAELEAEKKEIEKRLKDLEE